MNKDALKNNAHSFYSAAKRCLEQRPINQTQFEWLVVPAIVNLAFSIELCLKYNIILSGKDAHGHELLNLFNSLDVATRLQIINLSKFNEQDFMNHLDFHSKIFIEWRYLHEKNEANVNLDFLQKFAESLNILSY